MRWNSTKPVPRISASSRCRLGALSRLSLTGHPSKVVSFRGSPRSLLLDCLIEPLWRELWHVCQTIAQFNSDHFGASRRTCACQGLDFLVQRSHNRGANCFEVKNSAELWDHQSLCCVSVPHLSIKLVSTPSPQSSCTPLSSCTTLLFRLDKTAVEMHPQEFTRHRATVE